MNAEVKPGYKQTEVGVLPVDWEARKLGELASFRTGPFGSALHKSDYTNDGIPVVNPMHILDGRIAPTASMTITEEAANNLEEFRLKPGEVIIGRRGDMGRCAVVSESERGWLCGTGSMIVRPSVSADAHFLQRVLSSPSIIKAIEGSSVGSTMINLNQGTLSTLVIQAPPIEEQRAVAAALSDMDTLIGSLNHLIAKKRDIQQAAMQQLLTGQRRLPGFSGEWRRHLLRDLVSSPITDGPHETPKFVENGIPFLSVNNIANNRIDFSDLRFISREDHLIYSKKCRPQRNDLLLGKAASVGKVALIETDLELNIWSPIALIRISDAHDPRYFYYAFRSKEIGRQIEVLTNSSSQGNIGMGDIERLFFNVPHLAEQTTIATILSDMDTELATLEARRDKARQLKQSMMQELLTGRIRLV